MLSSNVSIALQFANGVCDAMGSPAEPLKFREDQPISKGPQARKDVVENKESSPGELVYIESRLLDALEDGESRTPAGNENNRHRKRVRPEQQGRALDAFRDDVNHKNPAPTLIILDDDEPEESHPNTSGQGRGSAGTSVTSSQSVQLVEARIAKKVKERIVLCTACGTRITRLGVVKHPMPLVAICRPYKIKYKTHVFTKDSRGFESRCRLCASEETAREECAVGICDECWARNGLDSTTNDCVACCKALLKPL